MQNYFSNSKPTSQIYLVDERFHTVKREAQSLHFITFKLCKI